MKKLLCFLCAVACLFVGCTHTPEPTSASEQPMYVNNIALTADTEPALADWNRFYTNTMLQGSDSIHLQQLIRKDAVLSYSDGIYTITDDAGSRQYSLLLEAHESGESADSFQVRFYLSNGSAEGSETLFTVSLRFDPIQRYGTVPEYMHSHIEAFTQRGYLFWGKDSYYHSTKTFAASSSVTGTQTYWEQHSYTGELLCRFTMEHSAVNDLLELENGDFLIVTTDNGDTSLLCFDKNGLLSWSHSIGSQLYPQEILAWEDRLYLFCKTNHENAASDLALYCLDRQGSILARRSYGGSDFENIDFVAADPNGFTLYGSTQSKDGPFPFSQDGYPKHFIARVLPDLTLQDIRADAATVRSIPNHVGFLKGAPVYDGDPILIESTADQLPESCLVYGIFDTEDGYVVVRQQTLGYYHFHNLMTSYTPSYRRLILTGYNTECKPLWQTASNIYVY